MSDQLLEWLSFRGSGRIADLPAEMTGTQARWRIVDDLLMLGHLEIEAETWRIAPPTLAGLPGTANSNHAVLCGARTPGVMSRLATASAAEGGQITVVECPGLPSAVRVAAASAAGLESIARAASIHFQPDAALALLACTPSIRQWPRTPCAMVIGRAKTVRRFSRRKLGWIDSSLDAAQSAKGGFFRIQRDYDWVSIIKTAVAECAYIDDRAGRMAACAKLNAISWDHRTDILTLPSQLMPPGPISRALVLCTGRRPGFDRAAHRISFAGVTPEVFRLATDITGLRSQ